MSADLQFAEESYHLEVSGTNLYQLNRAITSGVTAGIFALPKGPSGKVKLAPKKKASDDEVCSSNVDLVFLALTHGSELEAYTCEKGSCEACCKEGPCSSQESRCSGQEGCRKEADRYIQGKEACLTEGHPSCHQESCHPSSTEEGRPEEDYRWCPCQETCDEISSTCQKSIQCEDGREEEGKLMSSIYV
jgi:hypothetical protein